MSNRPNALSGAMSNPVELRGIPAFAVAMFYMGLNFGEGNVGWFAVWTILAGSFLARNYWTTNH